MKFYFKIYISYIFFFILNIIMFSFISISIYRLLCSDSYSIDFLFKDYSIYFFFFFLIIILFFYYLCIIIQIILLWAIIFFLIFLLFIIVYLIFFFFFFDDSIFQLYFFTKVAAFSNLISFFCLQNYILIFNGETSLVFFRLINFTIFSYNAISIYIMFPINSILFLNKIQCFCFSKLFINQNESIDLPVILYIDFFFTNLKKIYLFYLLILFR